MGAKERESETYMEHPNRDKVESKATKAIVFLLMVATVVLMLIVTIGGFKVLRGALPLSFLYIIIYALMAFFVLRWNRGVLPVAAGMSILLAVLAGIAAPGWFARDKDGFEAPSLPASLLGLLTIILIPVSVALVLFAVRGFTQKWNVEVERRRDGSAVGAEAAGA